MTDDHITHVNLDKACVAPNALSEDSVKITHNVVRTLAPTDPKCSHMTAADDAHREAEIRGYLVSHTAALAHNPYGWITFLLRRLDEARLHAAQLRKAALAVVNEARFTGYRNADRGRLDDLPIWLELERALSPAAKEPPP